MGRKKKETKPKDDNLEQALAEIRKQFGEGSIMKLSENPMADVSVIPTGSFSLDVALGVGGFPRGRIVEIFGPPSSGKTTLALNAIKQAQLTGGKTAFIDAEHGFDSTYANIIGVNLDELLVSQPDCGEQALEIAEKLVDSNAVDLIVIDSVAALTPRAEIEGEMGDSVTFDTPVYVRNKLNKYLDIVPISDLAFKMSDKNKHKNRILYKKQKSLEIFTHRGWQDIEGVIRKINKNKKNIICTRTSTGYVKTTEDHSLFVNGKEKSPKELEIFDRVDIKNINEINNEKIFINEEIGWLIGFWVAEGSKQRTLNCNRFEVCNVNKKLIDKCLKIIKNNFLTKILYRVNFNEDTINQPLHVISCSSCEALGYLMRQSSCKNSKLKKIPIEILNAALSIKKAFLEGFWYGDGSSSDNKNIHKPKKYHNNSMPVMAGIQYLNNCLNIRTNIVISKGRPEQLTLSENLGKIGRKENEILQFYDYKNEKYLWDISTASGTFVSAIGNIVLHNSHMGLQARLMSQAMRKLTSKISKTNTCIIFINQMRKNIGVRFGPTETTTGGNALKFYASIRLDLRRIESIKKGEDFVGNKVRATVKKNKVAPPFKKAEFYIFFDEGISATADVLDLALKHGIAKKAGAWISFEDENIGQGFDNTKTYLKENPKVLKKMKTQVCNLLGIKNG